MLVGDIITIQYAMLVSDITEHYAMLVGDITAIPVNGLISLLAGE